MQWNGLAYPPFRGRDEGCRSTKKTAEKPSEPLAAFAERTLYILPVHHSKEIYEPQFGRR
jgi:hypothetical protein